MFGHTGMCPFGVIPPRTSLRQGPKWDGGHNLLLFLVSLKSSPWQWQGFQQDDRHNDSPEWLCYKSLTHPKCTKSHLQWSRFQKIFPGGRNPRTPAFEGPLCGRGGREGKGMWRDPESGLPLGPRWLSAGLEVYSVIPGRGIYTIVCMFWLNVIVVSGVQLTIA